MTTSRKGLFRDNTNENKRVENPNWHFPEQQQKVAKAGLEPEKRQISSPTSQLLGHPAQQVACRVRAIKQSNEVNSLATEPLALPR